MIDVVLQHLVIVLAITSVVVGVYSLLSSSESSDGVDGGVVGEPKGSYCRTYEEVLEVEDILEEIRRMNFQLDLLEDKLRDV